MLANLIALSSIPTTCFFLAVVMHTVKNFNTDISDDVLAQDMKNYFKIVMLGYTALAQLLVAFLLK